MRKGKRNLGTLLAAAAAAALLLPGCVVAPAPPGTVYASFGPPAPIVEVAGVAPGPDYVWIEGHHVWHGDAYAWQAGRWERRPHANAHWSSGQWVHHEKGWYWREGQWK